MSTDGSELPKGWTRATNSDEQAGQYNPQQPIHYEHADGIALHAQPATNTAGTDQDVWRINVVRDSEGRGAVESLREGCEGRDTAIGIAREFMETYNERCVEGPQSTDDLVSSF